MKCRCALHIFCEGFQNDTPLFLLFNVHIDTVYVPQMKLATHNLYNL